MSDETNLPVVAVTEVSKVWSKQFGNFLHTVFGPLATEAGEIMGLNARYWKALNTLSIAEKLQVAMKKRGVATDKVRHLGFAEVVPLIEAASFEESDEVQDLWADLLASALDPESGVTIEKVFVSLLKEIGPAEARLLRLVHRHGGTGRLPIPSEEAAIAMEAEIEMEWRNFSQSVRDSAMQNLRRLGCIAPHVEPPNLRNLLVRIGDEPFRHQGIAAVDPVQFQHFVQWIVDQLSSGSSVASTTVPPAQYNMAWGAKPKYDISELLLVLTPLGRRLMDAIGNCPDPQEARTAAT